MKITFLKIAALAAAVTLSASALAAAPAMAARPNILILMADDWGWPHAAQYGDHTVKTPALDCIAKDGVIFNRAYCSAPSCAPSRAALFTGRNFWELEEGANLLGTLPAKFTVYNDLLKKAGYAVASVGKGYSPANVAAGGRTENPSGPGLTPAVNGNHFEKFLQKLPPDQPFCFWFGSRDPHRPYVKGSGVKAGINPAKVQVPGFLPDTSEVRSDLCDYYFAVQRFNDDAMRVINALKKSGRYDNTLIFITGDNGAPFPHGKTQIYEWGVHQPLAICWKGRVPGGRTVEDYTCFTDFAPTLLEAAGLPVPAEMTGKSLLPVLLSGKSGQVDPQRDAVFVGREQHTGSYPMRAIRTKEFSYIRNFAIERDPNQYSKRGGPAMEYMMAHKDDNAPLKRLYAASFGPRPAEELYDLQRDPNELTNLAADLKFADVKKKLSDRLMAYLTKTKDPRALGNGEVFDNYRTWQGDVLMPPVSQRKPGADAE
ncbi:MAG: sulfatase [Verrucomicrobia bacterium]|nr:sulfatase [Verrucomicrobiota bacterium]